MAHYDSLWEDASRDDIVKEIESAKLAIEMYKDKEMLLESDLTSVKHEISIELLRNESDKMVRWQQSYQKELIRLNKLLDNYDKGVKIEKYELFFKD